jgi:hypothetical protein
VSTLVFGKSSVVTHLSQKPSLRTFVGITMKFALSSILLTSAACNSSAFAPATATGSRFYRSSNVASSSSTSLAMAGLTLYGSQGSRSPLVNWGANEVGLELTMGNLDSNPHPFGQIPCLTDDDDVLVFESGAILHYVYAKAAETNGDSESRKASITSWISCTCLPLV